MKMIQKLSVISLRTGNRMFATCSQLRFPRKSSLQESEEFSNWKKYVKAPKDGEEIISSTNFGTVRLDSMNVPKRHGIFDEEMRVDPFESGSRVVYSEPDEYIKPKPVEVASNEFFLENPARQEDEIPKIGEKPSKPSSKVKSTKKTVKEEMPKETLNYQKLDKLVITNSQKVKPDTKSQEAMNENSKSEAKQKKKVKKSDEENSSNDQSTMNALQFVKKIRKEAALQKTEIENVVKHNKESEILRIGEGSHAKLKAVARNMDLEKISGKRNKSTLEEEHGEDQIKGSNLGYVDPKFLPVNLQKLTSAEVEVMMQKSVLFDKHDVVVINKLYGLPMFGDNYLHSVEKYQKALAKYLDCEELFQVHRLDKSTSGILVLAKTQEMHKHLANLFMKRKIDKTYWAIVNGTPNPPEAVIDIPICEAKLNGRYRMTVNPDYKSQSNLIKPKKIRSSSANKPAITNYRTIKSKGNAALLEVNPITGYKHQIRVHFGLGMNTPVLGDSKYSSVDFNDRPQKVHGDLLERLKVKKSKARDLPILLHAKSIKIPEIMTNKDLYVTASLPHHYVRIMKALKLNPRK